MKIFLLAFAVISTMVAQSAFAITTLPTSGTCGLLLTLPVPLGQASNTGTTYNILGTLTFNSSSAATFNAYIANVAYGTAAALSNGSPILSTPNIVTNAAVTISIMTTNGGFTGGYLLNVAAGPVIFTLNAAPTNNGNTIFLQSGGPVTNSIGPASGICQF